MSIFGDIWNKIVGHPDAPPPPAVNTPAQPSSRYGAIDLDILLNVNDVVD